MRWLLFFLFMILIIGADIYVLAHQKPAAAPVIAARAMEPNHLVGPTDVLLAPAGGKYVSRHVNRGDPIGDLVDAPTLAAAGNGNMIVGLPVDRSLVIDGSINEGTQVHLCHGAKPATLKPAQFPVRTVMCPASGACSALIEVPVDQAAALNAAITGERTVPRSKDCG